MLNWIDRHPRVSLAVAFIVGVVSSLDSVLSLVDRSDDIDLSSWAAILGSVLDLARLVAGPVAMILAVLILWRLRQPEGGLRTYPPTVTVAPRDPKWDRGDQLMFEGLSLLDEIRKGGDREEQATAWLEDVREFLKANNPHAWAAFDAPTGLLPYRSSGAPRDIVDLATAVDRALFLIRQTNPRIYGRAHVAQGGGS